MKEGSHITSVERKDKQGNASLPSDRGTAHAQYEGRPGLRIFSQKWP